MIDDELPPVRPALTARPAKLSLGVSGARIGSAVRPIADGPDKLPALPANRFGLRAHASSLAARPLLPVAKPDDEVA
jgi:hypothetical protein